MADFPLDHLSASSINLFMRCPRQWQDSYIRKNKGPAGTALVIGSAVHIANSRLMRGEDAGNYWKDALAEYDEIHWGKENEEKAKNIADLQVYHYWEMVGKFLQPQVVATEQEFNIEIEGVDIPVVGFVDLETDRDVIDYKTTAYMNPRGIRVNKEWVFQQGVYQLIVPKPGQIHVITRSPSSPVIVPDGPGHGLYIGLRDREKVVATIKYEYHRMLDYWNRYGDEIYWPGNPNHEWAAKYCGVENCCKL